MTSKSRLFLIGNNEHNTLPKTFKIRVTVGRFCNRFDLVVNVFSDGVCISNFVLGVGESGGNFISPFVVRVTDSVEEGRICCAEIIGDSLDKKEGFIKSKTQVITKEILEDIISSKKIVIKLERITKEFIEVIAAIRALMRVEFIGNFTRATKEEFPVLFHKIVFSRALRSVKIHGADAKLIDSGC